MGSHGFQSIGVTKDWRPPGDRCFPELCWAEFPINRRHQGLATLGPGSCRHGARSEFPINRRHQGLATCYELLRTRPPATQFPINRRHQGLATCLIIALFAYPFSDVSNQ